MKATLAVVVTVLLGVWVSGCHVEVGDRGKEETRTVHLEKPRAEMVDVTVAMGAGELDMSGGSDKLMEGRFTSSDSRLEPDIQYEDSNFRGRLSVRNKSKTATMGNNSRTRWEIKLADDVRIDLNVTLGAGQSDLKLGSLTIRSAKVQLGAGKVELDLRGPKKSSCDVEVRGGVGEATVLVPSDVGVVAEAQGGLGEVHVSGLQREGGRWVNSNYGKSPITIRLDVKGGIGAINIRAE